MNSNVGPERPGETFAIIALVSGILAYVFLPFIGAVLAVVFGLMSRSECRKAGVPPSGVATAAVVLGALQLALLAIGLVIFLALFLGTFLYTVHSPATAGMVILCPSH
jgi:hypothetical protein